MTVLDWHLDEHEYVEIKTRGITRDTEEAVLLDVILHYGHYDIWFPRTCIKDFGGGHYAVKTLYWKRKIREMYTNGLINAKQRDFLLKPKPKAAKSKGNGMNSKQLVHLIQQGYTTIKVKYIRGDGNGLYTYKTNLELKEDDLVVVPARGDMVTAVVREVHDEPKIDLNSDIDYQWVAQKVDLSGYEKLLAQETELAEKITSFEHKQRRNALLNSLGISEQNPEMLALTNVGKAE